MPVVANLGIRAPDIDAELWFLNALGGRALLQSGPDRWHLMLGDTRIVMFRRAPYDDRLERAGIATASGIAHIALETDALTRRAEPLIATYDATVPALPGVATSRRGPCRVTFYAAPSGAIFETQEFPQGGAS